MPKYTDLDLTQIACEYDGEVGRMVPDLIADLREARRQRDRLEEKCTNLEMALERCGENNALLLETRAKAWKDLEDYRAGRRGLA